MSVEIEGVDIVVQGLSAMPNQVRAAAFRGVIASLQRGLELSRGMLNEADHSLHDLAVLGHPYSKEHPQQIHDPDEIVHAQTGEYIESLRVGKPRMYGDAEIVEGDVHVDDSMEELNQFIQTGTTKMRARPWMQYIIDEFGHELSEIVESAIVEALEEQGAA